MLKAKVTRGLRGTGDVENALAQVLSLDAKIDDLTREMDHHKNQLVDTYQEQLEGLRFEIDEIVSKIRDYCNARYDELTQGGRHKTVCFGKHKVSWRKNPPSVQVHDKAKALAELKRKGKGVRTSQSIDKAFILKNPDLFAKCKHLAVVDGAETFEVLE
ncbi:MAG: host-nuclease inhibitor Gam family protein [Pseudomonadota bacterium]